MTKLTTYLIEYCRIPTNYNPSRRALVEAADEAGAVEHLKEQLGDRGLVLPNYSIERVSVHQPVTAPGRVLMLDGATERVRSPDNFDRDGIDGPKDRS